MNMIRLGISTCLLGEKVRYDGGHKLDRFLTNTLGRYVEWVPVCPEVESGLPVPREPMRLVGDPASPRLVTVRTGVDHTDRMISWSKKKIAALERKELCGFVFKSRSPSSGMRGVKIYTDAGMPNTTGSGIFALAFMERFPLLPVEDEVRLLDPALRRNFIQRIFVFQRWRQFRKAGGDLGRLVSFHREHKYLILSHGRKHYGMLEKLVAGAKKAARAALLDQYVTTLMDGLRLPATVKKNTNALRHMAGYLKDLVTKDEKRELQNVIENYHQELVPLIVPITLIRHYVKKYKVEYLKRQYYLNPHPLELMLRNFGKFGGR